MLYYGFSEVSDGNMSFLWGDEADVIANRTKFIESAGIKPELVSVIQLEHGDKIYHAEQSLGNALDKRAASAVTADAIATDRKGLGLMLIVADCIPALLYDAQNHAVAIIHAGRKGVEQDILTKTVDWMNEKFGSKSDELELISGPSIAKESYVFDSKDAIDADFWGEFLSLGSDKKYHIDVLGKFRWQAKQAGLTGKHINLSAINTFTDHNYFSHRRSSATGEPEGRFALLAYID